MEVCKYESLTYLLRKPDGFVEGRKYPLLIMLHGAGTRGTELSALMNNPFFKDIEQLDDFPFAVIAPQCHADSWFDVFEQLIGLAEQATRLAWVDAERVYCMGASMGGYATWQLAMSRPELFAAIVPICGGGMYWNVGRLRHMGVWAFHGAQDMTVLPRESERMIEMLRNQGGEARLTIYPDAAHNAWDATYLNPAVYAWLLSHRKASVRAASNELKGASIYG